MKVEVVNPDEEKNSVQDADAETAMPGQKAAGAADSAPAAEAEEVEVEAYTVEPAEADADSADAVAADGTDSGAGVDTATGSAEARDAGADADAADGSTAGRDSAADAEVFSIADLEAARANAAASQERYLRLEAEWDNYRKRTARERETEKQRAAENLITQLLPVVDDIERAIEHAGASAEDSAFGQFVDGVRAVHAKFVGVLERAGAEVIDPAGEAFNMHEHQAVAHVEDTEVYDETVHDVYQKGYRLAGRVIRPAMVTVTKGGPARPAADAGSTEQA